GGLAEGRAQPQGAERHRGDPGQQVRQLEEDDRPASGLGGAQRAARRLGQRQQVRDEGRVVAVGLEVGQVDVPRPLPRRGSGPGQEAIDDVVVVEDPRRQRQAEAEACGGGQDQPAESCPLSPGPGAGTDCPFEQPSFLKQVEAALDAVVQENPQWFDLNDTRGGCVNCYFVKKPDQYVNRVAELITKNGICGHYDGE